MLLPIIKRKEDRIFFNKLKLRISVETIRLLQNPVISDVWKYLAVVVDIFSLNICFPMSIICDGFPTNLMHFCNVISRPNKIQRKY